MPHQIYANVTSLANLDQELQTTLPLLDLLPGESSSLINGTKARLEILYEELREIEDLAREQLESAQQALASGQEENSDGTAPPYLYRKVEQCHTAYLQAVEERQKVEDIQSTFENYVYTYTREENQLTESYTALIDKSSTLLNKLMALLKQSKSHIAEVSSAHTTVNTGSSPEQSLPCAFSVETITNTAGEPVTVSGISAATKQQLIHRQGNNSRGYKNCCGLTTIANINIIAGRSISESEVVETAVKNGWCQTARQPGSLNGGVRDWQLLALLDHYGIPATCVNSGSFSLDTLASKVEAGHLVSLGISSKVLYENKVSLFTRHPADHQILVTKVERDATGGVTGIHICDTSGFWGKRGLARLTPAQLQSCFYSSGNCTAIVTQKPLIRKP